jgi:hypothetical protein
LAWSFPAGIGERAGRAILVALVHGFGWAYAVWDRQCIDEPPDEFDCGFPPEGGTYCAREEHPGGAFTSQAANRYSGGAC